MTKKSKGTSKEPITIDFKHPVYRALHDMFACPIVMQLESKKTGKQLVVFPSVTHGLAYFKCTDKTYREKVMNTPMAKTAMYWASKKGMAALKVKPVPNWDEIAGAYHQALLWTKIAQHTGLRSILRSTGEHILVNKYANNEPSDFANILMMIRKIMNDDDNLATDPYGSVRFNIVKRKMIGW